MRIKRFLLITLVVFLVVNVAGVVGVKTMLHNIRTTHRPCFEETPEDLGFNPDDYQNLVLTTADGIHIQAQFFSTTQPVKGSVVVDHGAADDACLEFMYPVVRRFLDAGYNVLLITMRNFGNSEGNLTSFGITEWQDVAAGVVWLESQNSNLPVYTLGLSMGGGTSLIAAAQGYGSAVVLINPYLDVARAVTWRGKNQYRLPEFLTTHIAQLAVRWELGNDVDHQPMDYARDYQPTQPFLVIGGSRDQILPPKSYEDLNNILPNSELMWVDGRHNLIREDPAICEQVVNLAIDFFDTQTLKTQ